MKNDTFKSARGLLMLPLTTLCFVAVVQAQTAAPPAASASMPLDHMEKGHMQKDHMQKGATESHDMRHSMMRGMDGMQNMPQSGDTDKDFAMLMKVHHQQALDMAQMELEQGKSPEMKAMAKQIITSQKTEIAQFDAWLSKQK